MKETPHRGMTANCLGLLAGPVHVSTFCQVGLPQGSAWLAQYRASNICWRSWSLHLFMLRFIGSGWQPHPSLGRQLLLWSTVFWRPQCRSCSTFFLTGAPTLTTNPALFAISGTHSKRALF